MPRREDFVTATRPSFDWPLAIVLLSVLFALYDSYKFFGAP